MLTVLLINLLQKSIRDCNLSNPCRMTKLQSLINIGITFISPLYENHEHFKHCHNNVIKHAVAWQRVRIQGLKSNRKYIFDVVTLCPGVFQSIETIDYNNTDTITITTEVIQAGPSSDGDFSSLSTNFAKTVLINGLFCVTFCNTYKKCSCFCWNT